MKIGMVCPYSFDKPGGVQAHVVELAQVFLERGHEVKVLAPASSETEIPDYVQAVGGALAIPYNGSVSRVSFGPQAYRTLHRWVAEGNFDVLHIHEPNSPSVSMLTLFLANGPIICTFHAATTKSLWLKIFHGLLHPYHERIRGKIAVSELSRRWLMESSGSDAIEIPNGVHIDFFRKASPYYLKDSAVKRIVFLGRYDEPRKGMGVVVKAFPLIVAAVPTVKLTVVGGGNEKQLRRALGELQSHVEFLGQVDDYTKAQVLRSADVYCAPNLGGESFGIVLVEAMAAGAAVVASDLDAFRRVLANGTCGILSPVGDGEALARNIITVLTDKIKQEKLIANASVRALRYDWSSVADDIYAVYETVSFGSGPVEVTT